MEEIFSITLSQLKPDLNVFKLSFERQDLPSVRQMVHKIKPSFGFVGLPAVQQTCKQFEDLCANATDIDELKTPYIALCNQLDDALIVIESEYFKFKEYNQA
ncbi:MAG: Hpt domain-containing protein [Chitinophagaceae bacterium]|nr:Hpt domain-containing protein [Chitinophagaceae bacterium]